MTFGLLLLASLSAVPPARAAAEVPDIEVSYDSARQALADSAGQTRLRAFGNEPASLLTDEQLQALMSLLPVYVHEKDGRPADVVNLVFLGDESEVRELLRTTGWTNLPLTVPGSILGIAEDVVTLEKFHRFPPMSKFYLDGKHQAMNWSQPISFESRHHFRLWRTAKTDALGRPLWPGAGIFDVRVTWHLPPGHTADPHIDRERDYVMASLAQSPLVARMTLVRSPGIPSSNLLTVGRLITDGRVLVVELK